MSEYVGIQDTGSGPTGGLTGPTGGLTGPAAGSTGPDVGSTGPTDAAGDGDTSAKDKAMESAQAGKQAAGEVAQTALNKAHDVVDESTTQARNLVGEAREQLSGHAVEQHRNAVSNLQSLADELRAMTRTDQPSGVATDLVGQAADRTQGLASWLEAREPGDLIGELQQFARRRPGAFLAGALVAGVLAGRLTRGVVAVHSDDTDTDTGTGVSGPMS